MGISVQGGGIAVDASKMYLLNLSPDSDELTMYYLKDTLTKIGAGKDQDVQIRGAGVLSSHCILPVEGGQLFAMPLPGVGACILHNSAFLPAQRMPLPFQSLNGLLATTV
jgi:hypothetical protein